MATTKKATKKRASKKAASADKADAIPANCINCGVPLKAVACSNCGLENTPEAIAEVNEARKAAQIDPV